MQDTGIKAATTNIRDDVEAIARARQAECHELHVLHHIRMRGGRSVASAYLPNGDDGSSADIPQVEGNESNETNIIQGRNLRPDNPSYGGTKSDVRSTQSKRPNTLEPPGQDHSSSRHMNTSDQQLSSEKSEECGLWCILKTVLLLYAVIVATFLLYKYLTGSKQEQPSTGEAYDAVP